MGGPSSIDFIDFWGSTEKQRSCDGRGGGGAQRPVLRGNELKKTGARSGTGAHERLKPTSVQL